MLTAAWSRRSAAAGARAYCPHVPSTGSGWPELDDAMDQWASTTAALPAPFRTDLLNALHAIELGTLSLVWNSLADDRKAFLERFRHPFAGAYDRAMLYLSLSLGLSGPQVRMLPVGGLILRRHVGTSEEDDASAADHVDPTELAQLRGLLAFVTSGEVPREGEQHDAPDPAVRFRGTFRTPSRLVPLVARFAAARPFVHYTAASYRPLTRLAGPSHTGISSDGAALQLR
ncbi:MAG: hypothetical protein JWO11_761 [Nocardioides sp.]|nr:hypothetical protein [Nocardioides sp.]